ncbi:MAG: sulfite exporter TauE/SafE family protein [Acidimicrobiia bacterium]
MSLVALAGILIGLVSGFASGLAGIGGGVVIVPALVLLLAVPQHLAQGTALAVIVPTALMGTITHVRNRYVLVKGAAVLGLTGIVGAQLGARLALSIEADRLRALFGVFLLVVGFRMIQGGWRSKALEREAGS